MSIEENQTKISYRPEMGCLWDNEWQRVQPGEVAVVKLKPTSSIKGLPYRACNQVGELNSKHSPVVMRVPWFFGNDTTAEWVRVHTQRDETTNPKFWQGWQDRTWSKANPPAKQRWLEENADKEIQTRHEFKDLKYYGIFYFIYSSVDPYARPEFAIPVGQNFLAGDIYDQLHPPATTSPAAGGAAGGAASGPASGPAGGPARDKEEVQEEKDLPPAKLPKLPRRANAGSWPRGHFAGTRDSKPADNVFDLSCLYPAFYLRMLSTAKAQHQMQR